MKDLLTAFFLLVLIVLSMIIQKWREKKKDTFIK